MSVAELGMQHSGVARADNPRTDLPGCPITGLPPVRLVQVVSTGLLVFLWRLAGGGPEAAKLLANIPRFRLWESPCGLAYFDPILAGDAGFYDGFYHRMGDNGPWSPGNVRRSDYARAASLIAPGQSVLDVGCGPGSFSPYLPHARYVGLEPGSAPKAIGADVRAETVEQHAERHPEEYDAVCSFHVVEHVTDPVGFVQGMLGCLRPGGLLIVAMPSWPSAITDIPNLALNAAPHHLTWWTPSAMQALADRLGLEVQAIEQLPCSPCFGDIYWMGWVAPKLTRQRFFRHHWKWYLGLLWSYLSCLTIARLIRLPPNPRSFELMMVARKPDHG